MVLNNSFWFWSGSCSVEHNFPTIQSVLQHALDSFINSHLGAACAASFAYHFQN